MATGDEGDVSITDRAHVAGRRLPEISDEVMRERIGRARSYTAVLLLKTGRFDPETSAPIVWEHGRRNMALAQDGVLAIVLPGTGHPELAGIGVFDASPEEVTRILDADPGVQAGIFRYELHPVRGFPGASLPAGD